jgi:RNA polymerase sigma factor (sigma-70 family)
MDEVKYMKDDNDYILSHDSLASVYKKYARDLYAYGLSLQMGGSDLVEDAIHDVFIDLYLHQEKLAGIRSPKNYIMSILRRRLLHLSEQNRRYTSITESESETVFEKDAQTLMVENEEENITAQIIKHFLSKLNPHQQEAIHLRFIEGLSNDEVSALMGIDKQSLKNLTQRAIKKLRKEFSILS